MRGLAPNELIGADGWFAGFASSGLNEEDCRTRIRSLRPNLKTNTMKRWTGTDSIGIAQKRKSYSRQ